MGKKGKGRGRARNSRPAELNLLALWATSKWQFLATNGQADLLLRHSVNRNCHRKLEIKFWNLKSGVEWKRVWFQCEQRFTCLRNVSVYVLVCVCVCVCQSTVDCAQWVVGCGCPSPDLLWPSKHTSISALATHKYTYTHTNTHTRASCLWPPLIGH